MIKKLKLGIYGAFEIGRCRLENSRTPVMQNRKTISRILLVAVKYDVGVLPVH